MKSIFWVQSKNGWFAVRLPSATEEFKRFSYCLCAHKARTSYITHRQFFLFVQKTMCMSEKVVSIDLMTTIDERKSHIMKNKNE